MSYSSAAVLQMPSSYVPMSTEEMEYVEGGGSQGFSIYVSPETVGSIIGTGVATFAASIAIQAAAKTAKYAWMAGPLVGAAIMISAGALGGLIGAAIGNSLNTRQAKKNGKTYYVELLSSSKISGKNNLFTLRV